MIFLSKLIWLILRKFWELLRFQNTDWDLSVQPEPFFCIVRCFVVASQIWKTSLLALFRTFFLALAVPNIVENNCNSWTVSCLPDIAWKCSLQIEVCFPLSVERVISIRYKNFCTCKVVSCNLIGLRPSPIYHPWRNVMQCSDEDSQNEVTENCSRNVPFYSENARICKNVCSPSIAFSEKHFLALSLFLSSNFSFALKVMCIFRVMT